MGKSRISDEERDKLVEEFKASGLGVSKFAASKGVNKSTFYGWAYPDSKGRAGLVKRKYIKSPLIYKPKKTEGFKELTVDKNKNIEIELPGGVIIRVRS